jgi:hypothetical protein
MRPLMLERQRDGLGLAPGCGGEVEAPPCCTCHRPAFAVGRTAARLAPTCRATASPARLPAGRTRGVAIGQVGRKFGSNSRTRHPAWAPRAAMPLLMVPPPYPAALYTAALFAWTVHDALSYGTVTLVQPPVNVAAFDFVMAKVLE